jgi:hypothetical protein
VAKLIQLGFQRSDDILLQQQERQQQQEQQHTYAALLHIDDIRSCLKQT